MLTITITIQNFVMSKRNKSHFEIVKSKSIKNNVLIKVS